MFIKCSQCIKYGSCSPSHSFRYSHFVGIETESWRCQKVAPGPTAETCPCRSMSPHPFPMHRLLLNAGQRWAPSMNFRVLSTPRKWLLEPLSWLILRVQGNPTIRELFLCLDEASSLKFRSLFCIWSPTLRHHLLLICCFLST